MMTCDPDNLFISSLIPESRRMATSHSQSTCNLDRFSHYISPQAHSFGHHTFYDDPNRVKMRLTGQIASAFALAGVCQATLKSGKDVFTPKDMLSLPRPAPAIASPDGRSGLSLVGQYEFDKKRNTKSLYVIPLDPKRAEKDEPVLLVRSNEITSIGEPLWLDENTVAYLNTTAGSSELYSISFNGSAHFESSGKQHHLPAPPRLPTPKHLHTFPTTPSSLKFKPLPRTGGKKDSHSTGVLAFSAHVWKGASIEETSRLNKAWEEREDEGLVWDELYIRRVCFAQFEYEVFPAC